MNHFGIAFGVIVAVVLGGAALFDRSVAHKTIAQPVAATTTAAAPPTQPESTVAETTTEKNEAPAIKLAEVTPAQPKPQAVRKVSPPARSKPVEIPAPVQNVAPAAQEPAALPTAPNPAPAASEPAPSSEPPASPPSSTSSQSD